MIPSFIMELLRSQRRRSRSGCNIISVKVSIKIIHRTTIILKHSCYFFHIWSSRFSLMQKGSVKFLPFFNINPKYYDQNLWGNVRLIERWNHVATSNGILRTSSITAALASIANSHSSNQDQKPRMEVSVRGRSIEPRSKFANGMI